MKTIKCKCGATTMRVEKRESCAECEHDDCMHLKDSFCIISDTPCSGKCADYESDASESGDCKMGDSNGCGCWLVTCAMCQTRVDHLPIAEG